MSFIDALLAILTDLLGRDLNSGPLIMIPIFVLVGIGLWWLRRNPSGRSDDDEDAELR